MSHHHHHQFTGESGGSSDALEASLSGGADLSRLPGPALSARSSDEPRESRVTRVSSATDLTCLTEPARTTLRTCAVANQHTESTNQSRARTTLRTCTIANQHRIMVPELIPVLIVSQPAGDVSHKPGGRLPLLSARPAVTPATLKRAATNLAAW